jgi:hypothetical protein
MKNSKKIGLVVSGVKIELPAEALRTKDYWGKPVEPTIYANGPIAGKIVKEYVKSKYPKVICSVKSASFANGNSLDVHISEPNGEGVASEIYYDVMKFANLFEYGKYNGMHDIYEEYAESGLVTDKGTKIEAGVKYVSVNNKPAWGSYGDVIRMLRDMMAGNYSFGKVSLEEAIEKVKGYKVSDSNINKALTYLA